ncbi:hypothetical protein GE21DRAFT_9790 [Neurospora crassa]|uniref:Uncharacterized protein n=1 Tax=Neurospora crassa (strain ATCC 24698 / 74-OR23-1A / CBS 708.71 / DSM 1257 / FGSC 987) TaxID=367110 RepID=Q7S3G5_NEUCR|nr:hypothetical protein NCU06888 [Neurospora crassa OR74A]EAA29999.1 hypothetical protein NCU06888 [Neurospora crassa OR74A]KHE82561.1 hypothetical protein GE21DRAFT_9790 [Neurospora crassa]|eukprot:XP_959235.1 hypothetical protein NCU06888 [Neurospora crassa OR74A]
MKSGELHSWPLALLALAHHRTPILPHTIPSFGTNTTQLLPSVLFLLPHPPCTGSYRTIVSTPVPAPSSLRYSQQPAVPPSPSSTHNEVDKAIQTSIVAKESDKPTTTSDTLPNPKTSQYSQSRSLTGDIEKFSVRHFPVLRKELNRKIEERRLVNRSIRNSLARIEHCEKYMRILKTMEEELEAEKSKKIELLELFRQAEQRLLASIDDWEGMAMSGRDCHLEGWHGTRWTKVPMPAP